IANGNPVNAYLQEERHEGFEESPRIDERHTAPEAPFMFLNERHKPPERMTAATTISRRAIPLNGFVFRALHRPARAHGRNPLFGGAARPRCDYAGASAIHPPGYPDGGKNEAVLRGKISPPADYTPPVLIRKGALNGRHTDFMQ